MERVKGKKEKGEPLFQRASGSVEKEEEKELKDIISKEKNKRK